MNAADVRERAFAMPLTAPAYPPGPYRFYDREFLIITYRTDREKLRDLVPEPLEPISDLVKFEFIRMKPSVGPLIECSTRVRTCASGRLRALATRGTWANAFAGEMSGSRPDPDAVTISAGTAPVTPSARA